MIEYIFCYVSEDVLLDAVEDELHPRGADVVPVGHCQGGLLGGGFYLVPPVRWNINAVTFVQCHDMNLRSCESLVPEIDSRLCRWQCLSSWQLATWL